MTSVLIVEDEPLSGMSLEMELTSVGYQTTGIANTQAEAVDMAKRQSPDIILMDINLETGGSGIDAAHQINQFMRVPIVFVTAYASDDIIRQAGYTYPYGYVVKPYNIREVKAVIETALRRYEYEAAITKSEAKLKTVIDAANIGIWELDLKDQSLSLSGVSFLSNKLSSDNRLSMTDFLALLDETDQAEIKQMLESGASLSRKIAIHSTSQGKRRWFDVFVSDVRLDNGQVIIGAIKDVTEGEKQLRELAVSQSIFENMQEGVALVNPDNRIVKVNPSLCEMTGFSNTKLRRTSLFDLIQSERADDSLCDDVDGGSQIQREVSIRRADGSHFFALATSCSFDSAVYGRLTVYLFTDITDIKQVNERLTAMAYQDELTSLFNRAYMNKILANPSAYFSKGEFSLIFIDLDSFKLVNDTYGHIAGDKVLQQFAFRLKQAIRQTDILIRHGGDEFILLVDNSIDSNATETIVSNIQGCFQEPFDVANESISLTCSIGIACCDASSGISDLLQQADIAMYEAKQGGRNSHRVFSPRFADKVRYQLYLEQGLRSAIETRRTELWFQPIVDSQGNTVSYEGLCRWHDEQAGFIPPDTFIPIAERSWLIYPLGQLVFSQACAFIARQRDTMTQTRVNVNLSTKQVANSSLPAILDDLLAGFDVTPSRFVLEVTESALSSSSCIETLFALKAKGFTIALDDFGKGYSNLARLTEFPVDIVKLDKSITQGRFTDNKIQIVCDCVLNMCLQLGYDVVVEGIENETQAQFYRQFTGVYQQGYFYGKPASPLDTSSLG